MFSRIFFTALSLFTLNFFTPAFSSPFIHRRWDNSTSSSGSSPDTNSYSTIPPDSNIPPGYQVGMSTARTHHPLSRTTTLPSVSHLTNPQTARLGTCWPTKYLHNQLPTLPPFLQHRRPISPARRRLCRSNQPSPRRWCRRLWTLRLMLQHYFDGDTVLQS